MIVELLSMLIPFIIGVVAGYALSLAEKDFLKRHR